MNVAPEEALRILQSLIRAGGINPPGDITLASAAVTDILSREGIPFEVLEGKPGVPNVVAKLEGSLPGPAQTLMFNGHLDVVPPGGDWATDPFDPQLVDGFVLGRGSCDMKSGVAAALVALVSLKRSGARFAGTVSFTAVGDEEVEGEFGIRHLLSRGVTADLAVCCEPTDMAVELGNRGVLWVDVVVRGRSSHAGRPHLGVNAVHLAAELIGAIGRMTFEAYRHDLFEVPVGGISVVRIGGGSRANVIPDRCSFSIDRRLMPGETTALALEEICAVIERVTGSRPGIGGFTGDSPVAVYPKPEHEPFWTDPKSRIATATVKAFRRVLGREPVIRGKAAATDASHLVNIGKIPTVILGPGNPLLSHTSKEAVRFQLVLDAAAVYEALALGLLSPRSQ